MEKANHSLILIFYLSRTSAIIFLQSSDGHSEDVVGCSAVSEKAEQSGTWCSYSKEEQPRLSD